MLESFEKLATQSIRYDQNWNICAPETFYSSPIRWSWSRFHLNIRHVWKIIWNDSFILCGSDAMVAAAVAVVHQSLFGPFSSNQDILHCAVLFDGYSWFKVCFNFVFLLMVNSFTFSSFCHVSGGLILLTQNDIYSRIHSLSIILLFIIIFFPTGQFASLHAFVFIATA